MDPSRKRKTRLVVALTCALLLVSALVYTSFSASAQTVQPSQLLVRAQAGQTYELTGKVAKGSWDHSGTVHTFRVEDRAGGKSVPVRYTGSVPDPFREGREIIVDVRKEGGVFVGRKDSLVTKCPSKFTEKKPA